MISEKSLLLMFHCEQNTGYAIKSLEEVFFAAAQQAGFSKKNIFWSFSSITDTANPQIIACNYTTHDIKPDIISFIKKNNITVVLAFDLGFPNKINSLLKKAGVKRIISYWGASMSSINSGPKLQLKKLESLLTYNKPDVFIFESEAMRKTGTLGRGLSPNVTEVIYLGVDINKFTPNYGHDAYTYDTLGIPQNRKIVFYSGHMEERKGVRVIVQAAIDLVDRIKFSNIHFVICGNKNDEAEPYQALLQHKLAKEHVTFAGYRSDIAELMRGSHIGVIASTGWDSFTMSSVEMMSSGLPLIVSDLQGLSETVAKDINGYLINPGNFEDLATTILNIANNDELAKKLSCKSRQRAEQLFSDKKQISLVAEILKKQLIF